MRRMTFDLVKTIALVAVVLCVRVVRAETDLKAQMLRENRPALVLCVGGDWCVSGESVRAVFNAPEFREALKGKWLFGVQDVWDHPCPATVSNENARVKSLAPSTARYPALLLYDAKGNRFADLENLACDIGAAELARKVAICEAVRMKAQTAFESGRFGEGLDLIRRQTSIIRLERRKGKSTWVANTYPEAWQRLQADTSRDAQGWRLAFTMGDGYGDVNQANSLASRWSEGTNFIANLRARPMEHCSALQRQSVEMAEFALLRRNTNCTARCLDVLRKAYELDPSTMWGWGARGYLRQMGRLDLIASLPSAETNVAKAVAFAEGLVDRPLRARGCVAGCRTVVPYQVDPNILASTNPPAIPADQLTLVRAWACRQIGTNAIH